MASKERARLPSQQDKHLSGSTNSQQQPAWPRVTQCFREHLQREAAGDKEPFRSRR